MIKIALYGKGGIGKSTTVSNLSAALAQRGLKVLQVGCDPKADSTRLLLSGVRSQEAGGASATVAFSGTYAGASDKTSAKVLVAVSSEPLPDILAAASSEVSADFSAGALSDTGTSEISALIETLRGGSMRTVMDHIRARKPFLLEDVVKEGFAGVLCTEAGGPLPGQGCAGRAVITALEKLDELGIYETYQPDVVLYDVLGDVVCGGFAMPMRSGFADYVYILSSGENMALYAAANIALALEHFQGRGYAKLGGIIINRREVPDEEKKVSGLAAALGTKVVGTLSKSSLVPQAEELGQCLMQAFPDSEMAQEYRALARMLLSVGE